MSGFDVRLLALFRPADEENYKLISIFAEVHAVSGPKIHPQFRYSGSDRLCRREIPPFKAKHRDDDASLCSSVECIQPISVTASPVDVEIFADFRQESW